MKATLWGAFLEALKIAVGIVVFVISPKLTECFGVTNTAAAILLTLLQATLAALVVVGVTDVLFGRPTIRSEWRDRPGGLPRSGAVELQSTAQTLNFRLTVENDTILRKGLSQAASRWGMTVTIEMTPADCLVPQVQIDYPMDRVDANMSRIKVDRVGLGCGIVQEAELSFLRRGQTQFDTPVNVNMSVRWESAPRIIGAILSFLIKTNSGIDGFNVRGA
ncbi:hypothetical protein LRS71_09570 [Rhodococcus pyridinivorans]|uniref:hypothetical protein n=1 Tax=Rhodococcus pyridinivorans TaxID=103816 RepID=UPI001E2EBE3A|nr:hypothetical protein [Rhodococcus pyridinivorans]MCD5419802.1 hypothetical protein [Rhodococcus pyridinivorans]